MIGYVCVRVRVLSIIAARKSFVSLEFICRSLSKILLPMNVLQLGHNTLNWSMEKKAQKRRRRFTFISSSSWRNDNNSNSRSGRKGPRLSRPRRWMRGVWKRTRTRALFLFCCFITCFFFFSSSRFFQPSQLSFFSLHFFSLIHYSFFFFFRILDVPFVLVSKKQGREKDSGVLYASSSFPRRRFLWRRRWRWWWWQEREQ